MEHFKNISALITGVLSTLLIQYIFAGIKNRFDFSETQKEKNHEFDKRLSVLEERTKNLKTS